MNVYFISGMCVNCKVFNNLQLPDGYKKKYIEWHIPNGKETLQEYAKLMARDIETDKPFIIVGYSLGGIVMQEMNKFLTPEKNILISSIKDKEEIPPLFRLAKFSRIPKYFPPQLYAVNKTLSDLFVRIVYKMSPEEIEECVCYTSPIYMKWTTYQITSWQPAIKCENLYHIHGTKDQIFPYRSIKNVYTINKGDHLMVKKRAEEVSKIISEILLEK